MSAHVRGFTVVELLVVVAIIMLILAIMLPAMCNAKESARRTACTANLHQISIGSLAYTSDNFGVFIICRGREVQKAFNAGNMDVHANRDDDKYVDWAAAWLPYGLVEEPMIKLKGDRIGYQPSNVWNCPSREYKSQWEKGFPQLVVTYQYFAGIEKWRNPWKGRWDSASPITLQQSKPDWTLSADGTAIISGRWENTDRKSAYYDLPAHKETCQGNPWAAGGNQVYVDGSAEWVDFERMMFIHSWNTGSSGAAFNRGFFFYQRDLNGWDPSNEPRAFGSYWQKVLY